MTTNAGILKQVTALPGMTVADLKKMWKSLYEQDPPANGKPYLVRKLAYRIQELAFGGLAETTEKRMNALANGGKDSKSKKSEVAEGKRAKSNNPLAGTQLTREWNGTKHVVVVLEKGFEYQGRKFKSLSAIAREITGTQWSGPLFFGLRKEGKGK